MKYLELTKLNLDAQHKLLSNYKKQAASLPDFNMICQTVRGKKRYYLLENRKRRYISAGNIKLIEDIKARHFLNASIAVLKKNILLQEKLLREYKPYDYNSINASLPKAYKMEAAESPITCKPSENILLHRTSFGLYVRSKSEALIAEILHSEGVSFEYEASLILSDNGNRMTLHPDFTFVTYSGEKIYWEHMGMMSIPEYRKKALKKIELYCTNGLTIPHDLIVTMDTNDGAIDVMSIKTMVKMLLLLHDIL